MSPVYAKEVPRRNCRCRLYRSKTLGNHVTRTDRVSCTVFHNFCDRITVEEELHSLYLKELEERDYREL